MDLDRLDTLARSVASAGSRRSLLGLLSAVPLAGGLAGILTPEDAEAKDRRRRRKARHKRHKSPGKHKQGKRKRTCRPDSVAQTCAGRCGNAANNCKQNVDCGSCTCNPTCAVCFTCQEGPTTPGACVVDSAQRGDVCGDPGQVCQSDGACACEAGSCPNPTPICANGACVACSATLPCTSGCCDATTGACVTDCPACQTCSGGICSPDASQDETCCDGAAGGMQCQNGACVAEATLSQCQAACTEAPHFPTATICGQAAPCPACSTCASSGASCAGPLGSTFYCVLGGSGVFCGSNPSVCPVAGEVCCGGFCRTPQA